MGVGVGVNVITLGITGEGNDCGIVVVSAAGRERFLNELTQVQEPTPAKIITIQPIPPNTQLLSKKELLWLELEDSGGLGVVEIGSGR